MSEQTDEEYRKELDKDLETVHKHLKKKHRGLK